MLYTRSGKGYAKPSEVIMEEEEYGDRKEDVHEEDAPPIQIGGDGGPGRATLIGRGGDLSRLELVRVFQQASDKQLKFMADEMRYLSDRSSLCS